MCHSTPIQLRFPAIAGFTVRADFNGGAMSSDFGALLLRGVDRQTGLIERLASAKALHVTETQAGENQFVFGRLTRVA